MVQKIFQGLITDEGIDKARDVQAIDGWFISPYEFAISETAGEFTTKRGMNNLQETWVSGKFSAAEKKDNNKILLTITLSGEEDVVQRSIKEIYIKCKTPDGVEYLYSLVQPLIEMTFTPTVSQEMNFLITLTNTNKEDIYSIQYIDDTKLNAYQLKMEKGQSSGYCPLGADGIVPDNFLPLRDNLPIGAVVPMFCTKDYIPVGYLPCNGAEYTYDEFPTVYSDYLLTKLLPTCTYVEYQNSLNTNGSCAKFGLDTANNKFKVPLIADGTSLQSATSDSELSKLYIAGLADTTSANKYKGVSLRWFVLVTHGLIDMDLISWATWINQLNKNTNDITAIREWEIGLPVLMLTNDLPENYIRLEGASVLISDYPKLYAKYGKSYGQVDTAHFILPNFKDRVIYGSTSIGYLAQVLPTVKVPYNGWSCRIGHGDPAIARGTLLASSGNYEKREFLESVGATTAVRTASVSGTIRPNSIKVRVITRYQ